MSFDPDLQTVIGDPSQLAPLAVALDGSAVHGCGIEVAEPIVRRRRRRPTLASIKRQAAKANIPVAAYESRPDGTIVAVGRQTERRRLGGRDWLTKAHASGRAFWRTAPAAGGSSRQ